ncbi:MAG: PAS domain-containing protein [Bdellovibrionales bacterium]|nr:PAS domain-containing protein [Bdellovibrionales bacterium]
MLSQLSRSVLLLAVNYSRVFGIITGISITLLGLLVLLDADVEWLLINIFVSGFCFAFLLVGKDLSFIFSRGKAFFGDPHAAQTPIRGAHQGTGLIPLDELLNQAIGHIRTLQENVDSIGEEAEILVERYQVLTENLAASVTIRDQNGDVAYCSPYTEVLTGYSVDDIYDWDGDFFLSTTHPDDKEMYQRALRVAQAGEAFQFRYRFHHRSGLEMWAETRTVPILDQEGNTLSSLSITLDVTGTVRYQTQVEEKNRDLEDFAYMVSHDLKAPIFTIKGMMNLIEQDYAEKIDEDLKEPLEHIARANRRLESLVHGVLEYSKISKSEALSTPVDLNRVLGEVLADFEPHLSAVSASVTKEEKLPAILGDSVQTYQIFSNLVGNAIKYSVKDRPLKLTISSHNNDDRNTTTISVSDNGRGIPESMLETIFRPFQRVSNDDHSTEGPAGSGIGLASARKLAERHGGAITVQSKEGKGATFLVTFQLAAEEV